MVLSSLSLFPHSLDRGIGETPRHNFVIHFKEPKGTRKGGERESTGFKQEESEGEKKALQEVNGVNEKFNRVGPRCVGKIAEAEMINI